MGNAAKMKILVVDDLELNRSILASMLEDEYSIIEADNGQEALNIISQYGTEISLVLLDMVMPVMNGLETVEIMNERGLMEDIPVIMISSENYPKFISHAYEMGVTDFITRPFDASIILKRIKNTIFIYEKQRRLARLVAEQIYERSKNNRMLVSILSHIVEFRNGESGTHVVNINTITTLLLNALKERTDEYQIGDAEISLIGTASSLHDIGKISIPDNILNKPGKLTEEEFEIMKTHSANGADMIKNIPIGQDEPLVKYAYEIARWHHERYDGRGYPDHLKGEEIPISAQVVSIADVYDALTSERCYKKAFTHEKAIEMIVNGECGTFNPLVLQCLLDIAPILQDGLKEDILEKQMTEDIRITTSALLGSRALNKEDDTPANRFKRACECTGDE